MPTGLYGRSLIIIIAPMLLLQAVIAFVFMERHWQSVTNRLSAAVVRDISALVDVIETYPQDTDFETITSIARQSLSLDVRILPPEDFPSPKPKPFFSILDAALSEQLASRIKKPFWIDTLGDSNILEIRIRLEEKVLRVFVPRKQAYASNTHIFLLWMVGASIVLLIIAILFLRNQIRPIQRLAEAADLFGKGQAAPEDFRPRGASEVRQATEAFLEMRNRIERALDQRTSMLAGVSHDLRTVLTRFRLQLALVPQTTEVEALSGDVDDMQDMLQAYLDFARGDTGEEASELNIEDVLQRFHDEAGKLGKSFKVKIKGDPSIVVRPTAFSRLMSNLILNALRHGDQVEIRVRHRKNTLQLEVHDNGPGIAEDLREEVFKPFVRLDDARNQDETGTGLGLAISQDIVHTHGGEISLHNSGLGGLSVVVKLPV
ncbi:MAG: HAMP domain-containing protein [Rhizobiaceae bacterium]|nr:HAMP domain-containing protein [Rhizobiaceae bacterium]